MRDGKGRKRRLPETLLLAGKLERKPNQLRRLFGCQPLHGGSLGRSVEARQSCALPGEPCDDGGDLRGVPAVQAGIDRHQDPAALILLGRNEKRHLCLGDRGDRLARAAMQFGIVAAMGVFALRIDLAGFRGRWARPVPTTRYRSRRRSRSSSQ